MKYNYVKRGEQRNSEVQQVISRYNEVVRDETRNNEV